MALKSDVSGPGEYVKQIPVVICGNPLISDGSIRIFKHEFREMTSREVQSR